MSKLRQPFAKGYEENWSGEVFIVRKRFKIRGKALYKLQDWVGDVIEGNFYPKEMSKVDKSDDDHWQIEKVVKTRKRGKKKEFLIKFRGWREKFNVWVDSKSVKDL